VSPELCEALEIVISPDLTCRMAQILPRTIQATAGESSN
jgi:hypothetical protein